MGHVESDHKTSAVPGQFQAGDNITAIIAPASQPM
jgi:hypothetical protein